MSEAIQGMVDAYLRLNNRKALEELKSHRQRLAFDLKADASTYDFSGPIEQIGEDIAVINAALEQLDQTKSD
jgi:hypothetical protein